MNDPHGVNGNLPGEHADCSDTPHLPADSVANSVSSRTPVSSAAGRILPADSTSFIIDEAIAYAVEQITCRPLLDASTGIEHWIWTGHRLVRASSEAAERLRQQEALEQAELQRLRERQKAHRQQLWQSYRRFAKRLVSPLHHLVKR